MSSLRKWLTALLLMIVGSQVCAQTFYEIKFYVPAEKCEYTGLLTYTDDAHCRMRLVSSMSLLRHEYYEANYECTIEEMADSSDVGLMYYIPDNKNMPILMWPWGKEDHSDKPDCPFVVFDIKDAGQWILAKSFREVELIEMEPGYISMFYHEDEPEFGSMMKGAIALRIQAEEMRILEKPTTKRVDGVEDYIIEPEPRDNLHLIVTANTNVSDIGTACQVDLNRVRSEFAGISKVLDLQLCETIIANNDYSREALVQALEELKPGENDVVVFVYSGHGFRFKDQTDYYPNMDLSPTAYDDALDNYLPLSQVFDSITVKGARLNIILSDCCNSEIDETLPLISSNSLFARSNKNFDRSKMRELFLHSEGDIIATAASPGEVSWCGSNGGFFMLSLIESMRNQISALNDDPPSWDRLIQNAIEAAAQKSENNKSCKKQNGVKFVQVKSVG